MTDHERELTPERRAQGFRSQAHLDAFFRGYDHSRQCPVCNTVAGFMPLDDGMQPVMGRCAEGRRLDHETDLALCGEWRRLIESRLPHRIDET